MSESDGKYRALFAEVVAVDNEAIGIFADNMGLCSESIDATLAGDATRLYEIAGQVNSGTARIEELTEKRQAILRQADLHQQDAE